MLSPQGYNYGVDPTSSNPFWEGLNDVIPVKDYVYTITLTESDGVYTLTRTDGNGVETLIGRIRAEGGGGGSTEVKDYVYDIEITDANNVYTIKKVNGYGDKTTVGTIEIPEGGDIVSNFGATESSGIYTITLVTDKGSYPATINLSSVLTLVTDTVTTDQAGTKLHTITTTNKGGSSNSVGSFRIAPKQIVSMSINSSNQLVINTVNQSGESETQTLTLPAGGGGQALINFFNGRTLSSPDITGAEGDISDYMFYESSDIESFSGSDVSSVGIRSFQGCSNLEEINIPNAIQIGERAFSGCTSLATINIGEAIPGTRCFDGCSSLISVSIDADNSQNYCFANCSNLTSFSGQYLGRIKTGMFYFCQKLANVSIPNAVGIDLQGFDYCTLLKNLVVPKCNAIASSAFAYSGLETLDIGSSNTNACSIDTSAFTGSPLKTLTLRSEVGVATVSGNVALPSTIEHIYVPSALVAIYQAHSYWSTYSSIISAIQ